MKKVISLLLIVVLLFSITACSKTTTNDVDNETTIDNTIENTTDEQTSIEPEQTIREDVVGGWTIANIPFEEADADVKATFNKAKESMEQSLTPITFIGSQVVSGMNYGFLCRDLDAFDRYVYIYQNANGDIEKIEISKPGETLEMLPTEDEMAVIFENQNSKTTVEETDKSDTTQEEESEPKNAEEALIKQFGSKQAAINSFLVEGMTGSLNENDITLNYQYDEEFNTDERNVMKNEIFDLYKAREADYIKFVKDIEAKISTTGVVYSVKYVDKNNNEVVTIVIDNKGIR